MSAVVLLALFAAQIRPQQVGILENEELPASLKVTKMYQRLRGVPDENVLYLPLGRSRNVSRKFYEEKVAQPVAAWLARHEQITTLLTTAGVPYRVEAVAGMPESAAALDSELAAVLLPHPPSPTRWASNPLFVKTSNPQGERDPRKLGMIFTARLDGPPLDVLERMVADAVHVEQAGLVGPVLVDSRGLKAASGYGMGDVLLREALDRLAGAGFRSTLDEQEATWEAGPGGRASTAEGAAYYAGWYKLRSFQDIFGERGLARGAIAWHLASGEAVDIWSPDERGWVVNLLRRGAAATWGPVQEPYVFAFPHSDVLIDRLLEGASLAEAYWLAVPHVSWAMVLLGDPLYRPFAVPRPALVAEVYRAGRAASGEADGFAPRPGRAGPLLVRVACRGPEGASIPALRGTVRAGSGVARANGEVTIRALRVGESELVELANVEVSAALGEPFRVTLELADESGDRRDVTLEGRSGLARLTAEGSKVGLFASDPFGSAVVTGLPDAPILLRRGDLTRERIEIPAGSRVVQPAFDPAGRRVALRLSAAAGGRSRSMLLDLADRRLREPVEGKSFSRWIAPGRAVFTTQDSSFGAGEVFVWDAEQEGISEVKIPEHWSGWPAGPSGVLWLRGPNGEAAYQQPGGPIVEVLRGKGPFFETFPADDLSFFAARDQKRGVWLQQSADGEAVEARPSVREMQFGPRGRRVAWATAADEAALYDSVLRQTHDLGPLRLGWWSADEERFLYLTGPKDKPRFRSWTPRGMKDLLNLELVGAVASGALCDGGRAFFGVMGADVELDAWILEIGE